MSGLQWPPGPEARNGRHACSPGTEIVVLQPAAGDSGTRPGGRAARPELGWAREPLGLTDPTLMAGVPEVLAAIADLLPDRPEHADVMPLIRDAARAWSQRQLRQGTPVPANADLEAVAQAVYDHRYGLGPLAAYLRDPDVENVDVNGSDQICA